MCSSETSAFLILPTHSQNSRTRRWEPCHWTSREWKESSWRHGTWLNQLSNDPSNFSIWNRQTSMTCSNSEAVHEPERHLWLLSVTWTVYKWGFTHLWHIPGYKANSLSSGIILSSCGGPLDEPARTENASLLAESLHKHSKNRWAPTNSAVRQDKAQGLYQQPDKKLVLKTHNFLLSDFACYRFWSSNKETQNCNSTVMRIECEWGAELCLAFPSPKPAHSEACWVAVTMLGLYRRGWHTTKHPLIPEFLGMDVLSSYSREQCVCTCLTYVQCWTWSAPEQSCYFHLYFTSLSLWQRDRKPSKGRNGAKCGQLQCDFHHRTPAGAEEPSLHLGHFAVPWLIVAAECFLPQLTQFTLRSSSNCSNHWLELKLSLTSEEQ